MKNNKFLNYFYKTTCSLVIGMLSISTITIATSGSITAARAKRIALKRAGGGVVEECELKTRNRVKFYDIEIEKSRIDYEVEVNASTGAVIKFVRDTDDSSDYGDADSRYGRPGDSNYVISTPSRGGNSGYSNYGNSNYGNSNYGGSSGYGGS